MPGCKRRGTFPFLKLSGELRNKVYRYAVVTEERIVVPLKYEPRRTEASATIPSVTNPGPGLTSPFHRACQPQDSGSYCPGVFPPRPTRVNTALLRVNRQISEEAGSILSAENEVGVKIWGSLDIQPQGKLGSSMKPSITTFGGLTKLQIHLDVATSLDRGRSIKGFDHEMEILFRAAMDSPALETVWIVFYIDEYDYLFRTRHILALTTVIDEVNHVFRRLSELSQVKTFQIGTK